MKAGLVIAACVLAACGTSDDDRPQTLSYITSAILQPTCGKAECHSTFAQAVGDVFDTVKGARESIINHGLIVIPDDETDPTSSRFVQAMSVGLPSILNPGSGNIRMPYDAPMPTEDIKLIERWIAAGASEAQCIPDDGPVCVGQVVTECGGNGNLGAVAQNCTGQCVNGACL